MVIIVWTHVYVTSYLYFPTTDKIQALKQFLFPDLSQREHSNFVQVKGHKYLSFSIFSKLGQENPLNKQINLNCLRDGESAVNF